jgi:hypothetical protein
VKAILLLRDTNEAFFLLTVVYYMFPFFLSAALSTILKLHHRINQFNCCLFWLHHLSVILLNEKYPASIDVLYFYFYNNFDACL